jgi:response regulator receiver modulated diguanylate cyclase
MIQEICVIDDSGADLIVDIRKAFMEKNEKIKLTLKTTSQLEEVLDTIPNLIIINEDKLDITIYEMVRNIRNDDNNAITPIIVVSSNSSKTHAVDVMKEMVQYYIRKPFEKEYAYYLIKNFLELLQVNRRISPLTGLPGNVQIQAEIKKRIFKREKFRNAIFRFR